MSLRWIASALLLAWAGEAAAADTVVPIVAINLKGKAGNVWSSEIYLVNPKSTPAQVEVAEVIVGRMKVRIPCLLPVIRFREVPAYSSVVLTWPQMSQMLGCPEEFLGAFVLRSETEVVVSGRLVNERPKTVGGHLELATGLGQDMPGLPRTALPAPGADYMLPVLASGWCVEHWFDAYLQLANPGEAPVRVTLDRSRTAESSSLLIDGVEVSTPVTITVGATRLRQVAVGLPGGQPPECLLHPGPLRFDLFFTVDGEVAVTASVVDRVTQDSRTILPVRCTPPPIPAP
jgi:hypothetical protein